MPNTIIIATLLLAAIGFIAAIILFFVSKLFKVHEDPKIEQVTNKLPLVNCGRCGFPGCKGLAEAIVKAGSMKGLGCPVGNKKTVTDILEILDSKAVENHHHKNIFKL